MLSVRRSPGFLAVALLVTACGAVSSRQAVTPTRLSGPSPFASCPGAGSAYLNAEVEPQIAADPKTVGAGHTHLIAVWQQDRLRVGRALGIMAASSSNSGRTWRRTPLPFTVCAVHGVPFNQATDPWISIGRDGTAYAIAALARVPAAGSPASLAVAVSVSGDGGKTWGKPAVISGSATYSDKPSIDADPIHPGVAYAVWQGTLIPQQGLQGLVSKTTDGGRHWSPQQAIPAPGPGSGSDGNQILIDPRNGALYDVFDLLHSVPGPRRFCLTRSGSRRCHTFAPAGAAATVQDIAVSSSTDGGRFWSPPAPIAEDLGVPLASGGKQIRTGVNLPAVAISPRGRLFVVWQDARFTLGHADQILLTTSRDARHWSHPTVVAGSATAQAFDPSIAVNASGFVGITYDQLDTSARTGPIMASYWFRDSKDGRRLSPPRRIAGPFDLRFAPRQGGYFIGDYQGLAPAGNSFHAVYIVTHAHDPGNRTDVYTSAM